MKKSTLITLAVFAALLVAAVAVTTKKPERGITRLSYAEVKTDGVDRISITGKNPVELKKQDGKWRLDNGKEADNAAVTRLLDSVSKMKSNDLVTSDSSKYAEYEVDAEKGSTVALYAGNAKVAELTAGKNVSGGMAVRTDDGVFKVTGLAQMMFSKANGGWIEHRMFEDKPDEVSRVELKLAGQKPYVLVKKDNTWQPEDPKALPAGFRFDAEAARSLASQLASLRAKDFEDKDPGVEKTGLDDKADTITFVVTPKPPEPPKAEETKAEEAKAAGAKAGDKTPADGKIAEVKFKEGEKVDKEDLVFVVA